jgi:ATP phosphoribosyltransferase regulatory subunit
VKFQHAAERILTVFELSGFVRTDPAILQPADIFLDLSGEEIRQRLFLTADAEGRELALRPEFTIPVARQYLESLSVGKPHSYCYSGPIFRVRPGESSEFIQAGIESFGRTDREAADAEILARALEALNSAGAGDVDVRLGDVGLFGALLDGLALAPLWVRKLKRAFAKGALTHETLTVMAEFVPPVSEHSGLLGTLEGQNPRAARAFVEDLLKIAGISSVGGRSAAEIAERFLDQASNEAAGSLSMEARTILARYCDIEGEPDNVSSELRALSEEAGLKLDAALDAYDARIGFIAARGIKLEELIFSTRFGRNLDYYTGSVFEIRRKGMPESKPIVGGGRYDRLLQSLGAAQSIPAVGCAIFIDRLAEALA